MKLSLHSLGLTMGALVAAMGTVSVSAETVPVLQVSRVEVVLANHYRNQVPALTEEFAQAGMMNVHFQFARMGQPPQNIGLGREVRLTRPERSSGWRSNTICVWEFCCLNGSFLLAL